jgi:hypothetical protein
VKRQNVFGEIDADAQNGQGLPLLSELMRFATPSWHFNAVCHNASGTSRRALDGEVAFIREAFMSRPKFHLRTVEKWAYSAALGDEFLRHEESDPDWFEIAIQDACPLREIFRFAADPKCLKRRYLAQLLVPQLCWIHRTSSELPFQVSRLQGIVDRDSSLKKVAEQANAIYERAEIIERMRSSQDPALQSFAKVLLDHRNTQIEPKQNAYVELLRLVHSNVVPLFDNV